MPPRKSKGKSKSRKSEQSFGTRLKSWFVDQKEKISSHLEDGTSLKRTWKTLRPISIYVLSVLLVIIIVTCSFNLVNNAFFAPVDPGNDEPVMLVVGSGSSMSAVASKLDKMGLIKSKWGIKLLADFTNRSGKVKAGEYILDRTMSVNEILDILTQPSPVQLTARVTITEGMGVEAMAALLEEKGVINNKEDFIKACSDLSAFEQYDFIKQLAGRDGVRYELEGYLFPDTYDFYLDSSASSVINKLLARFVQIYTDEYAAKAEELGMSMNEVVTLASIVQSEGLTKDFAKISAVFHNRLESDMYLGSDVCIQYAINQKKLVLTTEELNVDSPYNMHKNKGLPPGPICSPGKQAIEAVLNPDPDIISGKYYYFTLTDPATGELAFSKTYEEHQAVVNKWRPVWEEYDRTH
ncbi:MAG: endolytic transglycosylase MltG [Firmicutes bacterium]|nr:endolytic transglycosylase MltG [Bacillota bacterium]